MINLVLLGSDDFRLDSTSTTSFETKIFQICRMKSKSTISVDCSWNTSINKLALRFIIMTK